MGDGVLTELVQLLGQIPSMSLILSILNLRLLIFARNHPLDLENQRSQ